MALTCLQQMVQAKLKSIKSGWLSLFAAISSAARDSTGLSFQYANIRIRGVAIV
jgi:Sec7-like guanine-nucleotide exchange factor